MKRQSKADSTKTNPTVTENSPPPARWPRLLDDRGAAEYLGVSRWTIRDWIAAGRLRPVPLPPLAAREGERQQDALKRVLLNRYSLDEFVDHHRKQQG